MRAIVSTGPTTEKPRCVRCWGTRKLILDDGDPVCAPCVKLNGDAAAFPWHLAYMELRMLAEAHGLDIVRGVWAWPESWPGVGDYRLVQGAA